MVFGFPLGAEIDDIVDLCLPVVGETAAPCLSAIDLRCLVRGVLGNRVIHCGAFQAAILDAGEIRALRPSADSENDSVLINRNLLTNRLVELTGAPIVRKLAFEPEFDLEQPSTEALRRFLMGLDIPMLVRLLQDAPHGAGRLTALLADLILEVLPHNHATAMERGGRFIAPKHVKRTVEHIQQHVRKPIPSDELAAVSGVSLRTLQYGFQKFLGMSISEFERSVRLEGARREIVFSPMLQLFDRASAFPENRVPLFGPMP